MAGELGRSTSQLRSAGKTGRLLWLDKRAGVSGNTGK